MSNNSFKRSLASIPLVGRLLVIGYAVVHLPEHRRQQSIKLDQVADSLDKISLQLSNNVKDLLERNHNLQSQYDEMQKQLSLIEKQASLTTNNSPPLKTSTEKELFADDHLLDVFYTAFEDKFRGNEETVEENLKVYLPYFKNSRIDYKKNPVLDIGSGRGEFLRLLKSHKISALGLDINLDMVERANKNDLPTKQGDALSFLESTKSQTYGAITGFHIVEHIPFSSLFKIFKESHRCLANDGFVIFETPNPENLVVGSTTFYYDPSHLHPLPPLLLAFTLETCGFRKVEILRLHPDEDQHTKVVPSEMAKYLFGPRDYAVIGYK